MNKKEYKGTLMIQYDFYKKIKSGEKKFEFRKLKKGIIAGIYLAISDTVGCDLGYIRLTPIGVNNLLGQTTINNEKSYCVRHHDLNKKIDDATYWFVKENYLENGIDYIVYQVEHLEDV